VSHVVTGNRLFAAALRGDQPAQPSADADLVVAFGDSGSEVLTAFASPGALERVVQVPFGTVPGEVALHLRITEILVHGWDIAAATGQRAEFDEAVAGQELEFSRGALGAIPPRPSTIRSGSAGATRCLSYRQTGCATRSQDHQGRLTSRRATNHRSNIGFSARPGVSRGERQARLQRQHRQEHHSDSDSPSSRPPSAGRAAHRRGLSDRCDAHSLGGKCGRSPRGRRCTNIRTAARALDHNRVGQPREDR
jgi:hypothetical protein